MRDPLYLGIFLAVGGLFSIVCSVMNYDFFIESGKAKFIVKVMGRNGARGFYGLLGLGLFIAGVGFATGLIPATSGG